MDSRSREYLVLGLNRSIERKFSRVDRFCHKKVSILLQTYITATMKFMMINVLSGIDLDLLCREKMTNCSKYVLLLQIPAVKDLCNTGEKYNRYNYIFLLQEIYFNA